MWYFILVGSTCANIHSVLVPGVSSVLAIALLLVQNLVWCKLHIVRLHIPLTEGDLRDLLWHSICAPKREIQLHLAGRSAGTV